MKRKIVKHGNSTLTISLPSKWAKANNLKNGQPLNLSFSNEGLLVSPDEDTTHVEKLETNISNDKEWYIHRILRHLYTYGYDELKINYSTPEQLSLIRKSLAKLHGFEIVDSKSNYCIIKCVTSLDRTEYEDTLIRVLWIISAQFEHFVKDCEQGKTSMYEEVNEMFDTVSRFINLCRRLINKRPTYDPATSKYSYRFLTSLMNISSFILYSYDYLHPKKFKLTDKELEFIIQVKDFYDDLIPAYQNLDVEKTKKFFDEREAMFDEVLEILKDKNPVVSHYFLDILKELSSIGNIILIQKINEDNKENLDSH